LLQPKRISPPKEEVDIGFEKKLVCCSRMLNEAMPVVVALSDRRGALQCIKSRASKKPYVSSGTNESPGNCYWMQMVVPAISGQGSESELWLAFRCRETIVSRTKSWCQRELSSKALEGFCQPCEPSATSPALFGFYYQLEGWCGRSGRWT
jgi:hypothetical protein